MHLTAAVFALMPMMMRSSKLDLSKVRVISFDITGTLLVHRDPIMETYAAAAKWARLPNPPSAMELKGPFKQAYKESLLKSPCFRNQPKLFNERDWWSDLIKKTLHLCGREYTDQEFARYFRRVYQHYGSLEGYELLPDTLPFLDFLSKYKPNLVLGITTNTPQR